MLHLVPCLADPHPNANAQASDLIYSEILPTVQGQYTQINFAVADDTGQTYTGPIDLTLTGPGNPATEVTDPSVPIVGPGAPTSATQGYTLSYNSGGPSGQGNPVITGVDAFGNPCSPCYIKPGNWSITFNVNFTAANVSKPAVTTLAATNLAGDGATLNGSANPNGGATTAWFEWGTTSALGNSTAKHLLGSGSSALSYTASINGLTSNSTYYFRMDASNSAGTSYGSILNFTTATTLPAPALLTPQNGATNFSTTPTFTWTSVAGATSYRIMVATTPSALPTDPSQSACGTGCVIDDTPQGTSYTPLAGVLNPGTLYYWQVHARSPLQYGTWSAVWSFTPGQSGLSAVTVSPSGNVPSNSWTTLTITLSGPAPAAGAVVTLASNNSTAFPVPSSITVQAGTLSTSFGLQAGTVSSSTPVMVAGTYNGSQQTAVTVVPGSGSVTTGAATPLTSYGATLNGTVNPGGASGYAYFQFSPDSSYGSYYNVCQTVTQNLTANNTAQAVTFSTTTSPGNYNSNQNYCYALTSGTTFYYRTVFYNNNNYTTTYGPSLQFTTAATPVTTGTATGITSYGATLNGTVNPGGASGYAYFQFRPDSSYGSYYNVCQTVTQNLTANNTAQAVTFSTTTSPGNYNSNQNYCYALTSGTTFYYRTVFYNNNNYTTTYGPNLQFTTIGSCTTSNPNPNPNPESLAAVDDFNGDCRSDLLWQNSGSGQLYEWLMNGTTIASQGSPGGASSPWTIQGVGDFNGDGYADILWRNSSTGEVYLWLMNGTTIAGGGSLGIVSTAWSIVGVGDFNGDGKADILWRNSSSGEVYLWLMNGTTIASQGSLGVIASAWTLQGLGDFNGDGKADILWRNSSSGEVYLWLVGDFNGDGKSDILWRNSTTGEVYIWLVNGTTQTGGGSLGDVASGWTIQGVGDYDGSGRADILWRNSSTGEVYIWLMSGTTQTGGGSPGTPGIVWQIANLAP
jgi:hypothetical protein